MVNFLALLGWSPGTDQEFFTREELVLRFSLDAISGGNAVFNTEKLDWFNQQHLARLPAGVLLEKAEAALAAAGLTAVVDSAPDRLRILRAVDLVKPRMRRLSDVVALLLPFIATTPIDRDPAAVAKYLSDPALLPHLDAWREELELVQPFDAATLEATLRRLAADRGIKAGALIHATRVAVTGQAVSPSLFDVLELIGRDRAVQRLGEVLSLSR
jgi:glutamyl-tRNA synthetase